MNLQPIIEQIESMDESMDESNLKQLNNLYCSENSIEGEICVNDEDFFNTFFPNSYEALQRCHFGEYSWNENFVKINGYGNVESFGTIDVTDLVENVETITEWCYDNQNLCEYLDLDFSECEEEEEEI